MLRAASAVMVLLFSVARAGAQQPAEAVYAVPSHEDGANVRLEWRCAPQPDVILEFLRMQVVPSDASGSQESIPIHWWFDERPERQAPWAVASAGQRLILPKAERKDFTLMARMSSQLFVRFEGSAGAGPTYTFDLVGTAAALRPLACHAG